jgi:hypothetical protein
MKLFSDHLRQPALSLSDLQTLSQGYRAADAAALKSAASGRGSRRTSVERLVAVRQELRAQLRQELRERGCPENAIDAATSIIILEGLRKRPDGPVN